MAVLQRENATIPYRERASAALLPPLSQLTVSITAVSRIAVRAQQQRNMVMRHATVSSKDDRDLGEERRDLVVGIPLAGLECDPVSAANHRRASGEQGWDATLGVGDAFAEHGPLVAHALLKRHRHIGRRQAILQVEDVDAERVKVGGRLHSGESRGAGPVRSSAEGNNKKGLNEIHKISVWWVRE